MQYFPGNLIIKLKNVKKIKKAFFKKNKSMPIKKLFKKLLLIIILIISKAKSFYLSPMVNMVNFYIYNIYSDRQK